jgi:hypothetical protein
MNGRRRILVLGLAAAAAVLVAAFGSVRLVPWVLGDEQPKAAETDKASDKAKEEKPEVKKIPIEEMYTTREHEGMKWPWHRKDAPKDPKILEQVHAFGGGGHVGASNIFLVRGRTFEEAVQATYSVFFSGVGVDTPALPEQRSRAKPVWVVVFFGEAPSDPLEWEVRGVTLHGKSVEVAFVHPQHLAGGADIAGYMFWIPLGELDPGKYKLTLFDVEQKEVVMMRQVLVAE